MSEKQSINNNECIFNEFLKQAIQFIEVFIQPLCTAPAPPGIFGLGLFLTSAAQTHPKTRQVTGTHQAALDHFDPEFKPIKREENLKRGGGSHQIIPNGKRRRNMRDFR
ncbi:hypothetical protein PCANC_11855 [Puccinia coronata f. sp. avenae]|uniref:Uncharacterized protein n=1 Tax=Puccinia coronata f. sp. avenae TaxID=200324 RepID=A0A2N5SV05_9BASI|nr:hypothetical protein PCANC_11855 [Puccinia coronata f. sp. avenae]PLW17644.1 hypothetical protein PCASD_15721 [Puccinia coronata f. sp. avenae]